jgi:hypothetical protein
MLFTLCSQGFHIGTAHLHEMGNKLCEALGTLFEDGWKLKLMLSCNTPQSLTNDQPNKYYYDSIIILQLEP